MGLRHGGKIEISNYMEKNFIQSHLGSMELIPFFEERYTDGLKSKEYKFLSAGCIHVKFLLSLKYVVS